MADYHRDTGPFILPPRLPDPVPTNRSHIVRLDELAARLVAREAVKAFDAGDRVLLLATLAALVELASGSERRG